MAITTVQAVIKSESGITADDTTNTWHFDSPHTTASYNNITTALQTFYQSAYDNRISPLMAISGHELNFYDTLAPSPKPPLFTSSWTLTGTHEAASLPSECAIVCSYEAAKLAGAPQARRRNRIYLGPWATGAGDGTGLVNTFTRNQIANAALQLITDSNAATDWIWQVYSPTNLAIYDIANGWVDNAWDTQRRRGIDATARSTWVTP